MKSKHNFIYILKNLTVKHRLSLRDQHDDTEVWYMHISPLNGISGALALILVLFIIILTTVAYTPILDLIPGYPGNKSRELLIQNIIRLDSMERELNNLQVYSDNVGLILDGKTPVMRTIAQGTDSTRLVGTQIVRPSVEDSILRREIESGSLYTLSEVAIARTREKTGMEIMSPVRGVVATHFNPKEGIFGVSLATAASEKIVAVEDGTVVLSLWSPDEGYVVQIQHAENLISVYKHGESVMKPLGTRVKAGEVIGYTGVGVSGEGGKGYFQFELWHNGTPVDPEGYIVF